MDAATLLVVLAIAGVNFGWQSAGDGSAGYEYIVQVEPELVDAMQRGDSIPIESNIPPEVAPIRKVRVVVGRGEVPRTPLRHTANFAGQGDPWAQDRYPAGTNAPPALDRYPAEGQSVLNRTETAVRETGRAISHGVQAGMQSAQDQFSRTGSQLVNGSQNAAQQFGQQVQSAASGMRNATEQTFDATGNQVRQAGNSLGLTSGNTTTGAASVSAPPWPPSTTSTSAEPAASASQPPPSWPTNPAATRGATVDATSAPGMSVTRNANGWSSIGPNVAAPPLANPPLVTDAGANVRIAQGTSATGPIIGAPASTAIRDPQYHSVLVDPARQSATSGSGTNDWSGGWGGDAAAAAATTAATIGRAGDTTNAAGTAPVQPRYPAQQNTQQAADRWGDPWAEKDPWTQQQQPQQQQTAPPPIPGSANNNGQIATNNGWPAGTGNPAPASASPAGGHQVVGQAQPNANTAGYPANPGLQGGNPHGSSPAGTNLAGGNVGANSGAQAAQMPWMPLLLVTLSLVGSLSANFYLVLSYLGARQKYVSLVQRTADTFRRATGAAAAA